MSQMIYRHPPEGFNAKFSVAAAFIKCEDKFLFVRSVPKNFYGSAWGIPGGKLEPGETPLAALIREIAEETSLSLKSENVKFISQVYVDYQQQEITFTYHMFEYVYRKRPEIILNPQEHLEYRWLSLGEALKLNLIPGEAECIQVAYAQTSGVAAE